MDVELIGIHKHFGPVHANNDISLKIPSGTIQGILGENGAGKSTLMKVLSGFIQADRGQILLDGREVRIQSPHDAITQGIGMLHQDPLDFPPMKLIDNFILGSPGGIFPNHGSIEAEFKQLQAQFDFALDPQSYIDTLTVGERQQLEILRLLWLGAHLLILDEPTTGISAPQKIKLFSTLRTLAQQGKTIIFVSHKLEDVEELCNRVAVLQQGRMVGEAEPPFDIDQLVTLMFGKTIALAARQEAYPGEPVMVTDGLCIDDVRLKINDIDLRICAGEVVGLAGMEGSGQLTLLRACAGLIRPVAGKITVNKANMTAKNYHAYMHEGVTYMPASRMEEGLISGLTLTEHFVLAGEQKGMFVDREKAQVITQDRIRDYSIRGQPSSTVESLSGGNQQRALLALLKEPLALILLEHPTRGLDVESSIYIWSKLKERCRQGTSILFISSDLEEILQYSDRILVFFAGKISPPLSATETSVEQLGQLIGGKGW